MTFLKELKENEFITSDYYRMKDNKIELGHYNEKNKMTPDTLLVIDSNAMIIEDKKVFKCVVKYFNFKGWTWKLDKEILDQINDIHAHNILVQFDIQKLLTDQKYYRYFMEELLDETRVMKYLQAGLEEEPKQKCGDYIGYIDYNEKGKLDKYFDVELGKQCHNLKASERTKRRELEIERLKREREIINQKIDELENGIQK